MLQITSLHLDSSWTASGPVQLCGLGREASPGITRLIYYRVTFKITRYFSHRDTLQIRSLHLDSSWTASGPVQLSGLGREASQRNSIKLLPSYVQNNSISLVSRYVDNVLYT